MLMLDTIIKIVAHYGYAGIFGALVLGIVGLPIPDEVLLAFAGYLVSKGQLHYFFVLLSAFLGSVFGMSVSFFVGHRFGLPLLERYGSKINVTPEKLARSELWFKRFGKFAVTIGYFVPGIRHFTAYSAGISRWPFRTFALYAYPGGLLWVSTFIIAGIFLGEHWRTFSIEFHKYMRLAVIVVLAGPAAGGWSAKLPVNSDPKAKLFFNRPVQIYGAKSRTVPGSFLNPGKTGGTQHLRQQTFDVIGHFLKPPDDQRYQVHQGIVRFPKICDM